MESATKTAIIGSEINMGLYILEYASIYSLYSISTTLIRRRLRSNDSSRMTIAALASSKRFKQTLNWTFCRSEDALLDSVYVPYCTVQASSSVMSLSPCTTRRGLDHDKDIK